jgi:voltage-gated potassium channel
MRARLWALGGRLPVVLTFAVALLSVLTGVANIGEPGLSGPLAAFVPAWVQQTAGFTGVLTGFLVLVGALGLRRGLRWAWRSAVVLFPLTAAQGLLQSSVYSLPLVALSLVSLPTLVAARGRYSRTLDLSASQFAALAALVSAQVYGTVGTYALRAEFGGVDSLTDAFYFTVVTGSTVGYGDITPQTGIARLFGTSMLLVSVASFAVALGALFVPLIEARFTKALGQMTETQLEQLEGHILVLGYGDLTEPILEELEGRAPVVIIAADSARASALAERGFDVLTDDPSDEAPLRRAGIERARAVVVATNNDAEDALAVLTARQLNPDTPVVAAATNRENVAKLRRAGASTVISPASIGGHLLVESALGREDVEDLAAGVLEDEGAGVDRSDDR